MDSQSFSQSIENITPNKDSQTQPHHLVIQEMKKALEKGKWHELDAQWNSLFNIVESLKYEIIIVSRIARKPKRKSRKREMGAEN